MGTRRHQVLLYNPEAVFFDLPLALLAIGSMLDRERYEVVLIDARTDPDAHRRLEELAPKALCLGVTVLTGAPIRDALEATRLAREAAPELPVIWGGWHPSLFGSEILEESSLVDVTVQAQGEVTFRELVERYADATESTGALEFAPADVAGLTWRHPEAGVRRNAPRALQEMDDLPPVDYSLIDLEPYFTHKGQRQLDYISSVGCPFRCSFCADPFVFSRKWSAISPERMGKEIEALVTRHRVTDVNFQDETFFNYRPRVVAIAEQFLDRQLDITWAGTMRADQGSRLSDEDFARCVESGLRRVLIGVESGSQEMLDYLKKDIRIEQVLSNAERCARFGVDAIFPFIVGFPGESVASVEASLDFATRLRTMSPGFTTPMFYFKPYPGSDITRDVVAEGYELPSDLAGWANFDYVGSSGPWVDAQQQEYIESYKFYNRLAGGRSAPWLRPIQELARWRLRGRRFGWAWERPVVDRVRPEPTLS